MELIKNLRAFYCLKILVAFALAIPLASNAACGLLDKKVSFADGSSACLNEFSFLNVKGLMKSVPNESYASKSKSHSSYAVAVTAEPMLCPFEQSMQWDWNGDDGRRAVSSCESKMTASVQTFGKSTSVQNCKCEILIDNGKTKFSRTEFEQRTKQYERQIALGLKPIQVVEAQIKEQADREAEIKRLAEAKKREDDRLVAMKERAEREEAERKRNAPPTVFAMRRALLIGNDTYKYADVLKNAREDARAMANELKGFGYEVTLRLDQNQKEMQATLRDFRESIKEGDEVLFYFSGHAVEIDGKNFLTPIDTIGMNQNQLADDSIDLKSSVLDPFTRKKAKLTLALIDACRNNPFLKTSSTRSVMGGSKGLAPTTPATGQLIVYSAGSGQTALDRLGESDTLKNGLFTRVFLQEMKKVDLPIDRVIKNVRTEVVRLARTIGHDQVPAIYDEVVGDFYFKK
jgi:hypothetical protein